MQGSDIGAERQPVEVTPRDDGAGTDVKTGKERRCAAAEIPVSLEGDDGSN
jgi:hypothetical protein